MRVNKELMLKVRRYEQLSSELSEVVAELYAFFEDFFDGCFIEGYFIADEPSGDVQSDGGYCDQYTGYICDSGNGVYYYPILDSDKYLAVKYSF